MKRNRWGRVILAAGLGAALGCQKHDARAAGPVAPPVPAAATPVAAPPAQPAPFATPPVLPGTPDVATLVSRVTPAVVNITTIHDVRAPQQVFDFPFGFGPCGVFSEFGPRRRDGGDQVLSQKALGYGFL